MTPPGRPERPSASSPATLANEVAPYARAALLAAAGTLDLVAGWALALDPDAPDADRLDLLAAYPPEAPLALSCLGQTLVRQVCLAPEATTWPLAERPGHDPDAPAPDPDLAPLLARGARTLTIAPIVVDDRPVGSLLVASRRQSGRLAEDALATVAAQLALSLEHVRRDRELLTRLHRAERRVRQLETQASERARLDRELVQRNRELVALSEIARAMNQAIGLQDVLNQAVERVVDVMQVQASQIRLVEGDELVLAAHRGLSAEFVGELEHIPIDGSTSGLAVRLGQPQVIDDCRSDPRIVHPSVAREGVLAVLIVPMIVKGRAVGVLNALSRQPRRFTEADVRLLSTLADEVAVAIESARLYEAERQRSAALEELNRLKTDFVLTVSHEFRTPLAIVKTSLDAVWANWERVGDDRRRSYVAVARQGVRRLRRLVEELLLVSRIEHRAFAPRLESIELLPLAAEIVDEVLADHPERQIQLEIPADLPPVQADRTALTEIVVNLLDNAAKYSAAESPISLGAQAAPGEVQVSVADQGIGIAPEDMGRLFRRFERIDPTVRSQAGTGLGLYICRQLAESMGGRIWAESKPGRGSVFWVALCADAAARSRAAARLPGARR